MFPSTPSTARFMSPDQGGLREYFIAAGSKLRGYVSDLLAPDDSNKYIALHTRNSAVLKEALLSGSEIEYYPAGEYESLRGRLGEVLKTKRREACPDFVGMTEWDPRYAEFQSKATFIIPVDGGFEAIRGKIVGYEAANNSVQMNYLSSGRWQAISVPLGDVQPENRFNRRAS